MGKIFGLCLVVAFAIAGYFFWQNNGRNINSADTAVFGSTEKEAKNFPANTWFPKISDPGSNKNVDSGPYLSAKSAILVNYDTGDVLYAKGAKDRLPAASTIKIMTALIALENANIADKFRVSANAASVGENIMGLSEGEWLTVEQLLYGMMLVSGNDAAIAIAEGIADNEQAFVNLMNERAKSLGISDTVFVNASGLDVDEKTQYTSSFDLATIARYSRENYPLFRTITSSEKKFIEQTSEHKSYELVNDTNLLTTYPGVRGIKPGFTWEAGWCLVTYAENKGKKLIGVILGSQDRRGEMKELLDYGFGKYGIKVEPPGLDL